MRRAAVVATLCVALAGGSVAAAGPAVAQEADIREPGVGACISLPDPPLVLDWTIRAIKVALFGEIDCGL